jgi:hypothetical protein
MLPHEMTLALRIRLMQATEAKAKLGTVKLPNGKAVIDDMADPYMAHDKKDVKNYASYWLGMKLGEQVTTREIVVNWRDAREHFSKEAVIAKLGSCACGHNADSHEKDELDSLLKCGAWIQALDQACECDHFHYDVEESEAA